MKIINLTPHTINIVDLQGEKVIDFPSEGIVRVATKSIKIGTFEGVPVFKTEYGEVTGLPKQKPCVLLIVSMLVKNACPDREDLFSPSQLQRNNTGQPIGCLGLE